MKVLHVITGLTTGGAERVLHDLLAGGLAQRFDNQVVSLSDEGYFGPGIRELGVGVEALGIQSSIPSLASVITLQRVVREFRPDVIQGWMYHGNFAAWVARSGALQKAALAWSIHQSLHGLVGEKAMTRHVIRANRRLSGGADVIVYVTRLSRRQHEEFGFAGRGGRVIPNGFDLERFKSGAEAGQTVRTELGIPRAAPVVGHVARLHPVKDHEGFLRAAAKVAAKHDEVHFVLGGRDVVWGNSALAAVVPDEQQARFHLLGERSDVPALMQAVDILCQSSWSEAFPSVLGEAMATEVPCVATDVGDSSVVVGGTGIIVPPRDEDALAEGLERLVTMPAQERQALGAAARARVQANYSLSRVVEQYTTLYESLAVERGRA